MKHITFPLIFLLLLCNIHTAPAQQSFKDEVIGKGRPMVFIPGLYSAGEVWKEAASRFAGNYECHLITLPGFAGVPPIKSDSILATVANELAVYIKQKGLKQPIIVGHSLGGWLALKIGITHPEAVGDLVIVSSSPFLPALMDTASTSESMRPMATQMRTGMVSQTPDEIRTYQKMMLPGMISDTSKVATVLEQAVKSDAATQGQVMYELFTSDLRPAIGIIPTRILVMGDWAGYKAYGATRASVTKAFADQFSLAPRTSIVINDKALHFIMLDQPEWFHSELQKFLAAQ
jgi:N-formylmaleamate deformylase